jgi:hypothetical protein
LLVHADGRRHWPIIGFAKFSSVAPIRQFQVVQLTIAEVELRVAADSSLTQSQCQSLADIVRDALGGEFLVNTRQMAFPLPGTRGGKFEEFVSLVS